MNDVFYWLGALFLGLAFGHFLRFIWISRRVRSRGEWMRVTCIDENGEQLGKTEWVRIPTPDKIDTHGLNHVVKYVARLVKSQNARSSLIIASPDGEKACLVFREGDHLVIHEHVHLTPTARAPKRSRWYGEVPPHAPEPEKEQAIRALFADLGIAPTQDQVHDYNGYVDARRDLTYPIGNEVAQATLIVQRLLREVYHVQETDGLHFTFEAV